VSFLVYDASGKLPSSIALGNTLMMGYGNECLNIEANASSPYPHDIQGRYCSMQLQPVPTSEQSLKEKTLLRHPQLPALSGALPKTVLTKHKMT